MRKSGESLALVVGLGIVFAATELRAGPLLVHCEESDKLFMGVVGHAGITANAWHTLGSEFVASCGMTRWNVRWNVHEYEKNGNLPDEILFLPMIGTHQIAVPGHTPEDAPSTQSTRLPRIAFMAPVQPGFMPIAIPGAPALHTFHADGVIGLLMPFSNNRDVLMYLAGVVLYHSADPLTYFGTIAATSAGEETALGGLVVASPDSRVASVMLATFGYDTIDKAVLTINGRAEAIELDVTKFVAGPQRFRSFLAPALDLRGATGELLFTAGATVTIQAGDNQVTGIVRIQGAGDHTEILAQAGKGSDTSGSGTARWLSWIALALAVIALSVVGLVLGRRRAGAHIA